MLETLFDLSLPLCTFLTESVEAVKLREANALNDLLRARHNRCVILGAGTLGKKAAALFREIGVEPLAMCDSNPLRWGTEVDGFTILSPKDAAKQFGTTAIFFVTIWNDFHWFKDTLARLTAMGCRFVSSYGRFSGGSATGL
jgi:FlaA1/EpsC-like NDP-sugar epimerase